MSKSGVPIVSDIAKAVKPIVQPIAKALRPVAPILPFIPIPGMFGLSSLLTKSLLTGALGGVTKEGKFDVGRGLKSGLLAYGVGSLMNPATAASTTGTAGTGIEGFGAAADEVGGALSGATAGSTVGGGIPIPTSDVGISSLTTAAPYDYIDSSTVVPPAPAATPAPTGAAPIEYPREVIPGTSPGVESTTASGLADIAGEVGSAALDYALKNPPTTIALGTMAYGAIKTKEELEQQKAEAERILANQQRETAERVAFAQGVLRDYPLNYRRLTGQDIAAMGLAGGGMTSYEDTSGEVDYSYGGLAALRGGGMPPRYLRGGGDGMSDSIPARIGGRQEARLADGEFVVPADVVSHIGNGSSNAGAKKLYAMMDRARQSRTGKKRQAPEINARRVMPV